MNDPVVLNAIDVGTSVRELKVVVLLSTSQVWNGTGMPFAKTRMTRKRTVPAGSQAKDQSKRQEALIRVLVRVHQDTNTFQKHIQFSWDCRLAAVAQQFFSACGCTCASYHRCCRQLSFSGFVEVGETLLLGVHGRRRAR